MSAEDDFEEELQLLLDAWERLDIDARRLRAQVHDVGALDTAKEYVRRDTGGLGEAYRRLGPRHTFEGLVLRYRELFDEETLGLADAKLEALAREDG
jgi:hypothetical protein